ncbi:hypothetical protein [Dysgonomonas macrotermitis]|uniref:Uncharacterized protein n=1 Tax=Dysgonomonas macrotermitis TaxID=1346286 RepID=A0A1M5AT54_9BACT|nr:hypothetical protein [Dysgonomonas macrotermitis]SHF33410.1 hypothetical protein SAMN05444362_105152 [Dysgonomonas macrotermitis]
MKRTQNFYLTIIALLTIVFSSCGSDDDNRSSYTLTSICETKVPIKGYADQTVVATDPTVVLLDDMLKGKDYVKPIIKGELFATSGTALEIVGLKEGVSLKSFKITINDVSKTFTEVKSSDPNLYTTEMISFMQETFARMITRQKLVISISFTPTQTITEADNVYLKIAYNGRFTYLK